MPTHSPSPRWDSKRYHLERACTCRSRSAECATLGWHVVDTLDTMAAALADAARMTASIGVAYRAKDSVTGATA
jgi:hypothetical protein